MSAPRFTLYGLWLSGPTYKVGLMLALTGQAFDYVHTTPREGAKTPDYLARNKFGVVPCLHDANNGRNLSQSAAILDYLADVTGRFGGATLEERIQAREWMYWDFDRLAPHVYRSRGMRLGFRSLPQPVAEMHFTEGSAALAFVENHLKGRDWLVGEGATIADIDLYGVLDYAEAGGFAIGRDYPAIAGWMARMEALPGFGKPEAILPKADRRTA